MDIIQEWRVTVGILKSLRDHYRQRAKQPLCFHYNTVARINCTAYSYTDFRKKTRIRTGLLVYFFFFFTLCTRRLCFSSEKERQTLINNDYFTHHQRRGTFCLSRTWSYVVKAYSRKSSERHFDYVSLISTINIYHRMLISLKIYIIERRRRTLHVLSSHS